jgi:hypothetical protein
MTIDFLRPGMYVLMAAIPVIGFGIGWLVGTYAHKGTGYKIQGMTDQEIRGLMETLRKKAMVPDYK